MKKFDLLKKWSYPNHFLICTVLTVILSVFAPHHSAAEVSGQDKTVTLNLADVPFKRVFDEISRQSGYTFLFNNAQIGSDERVSVNARNEPVASVLSRLFTGKNLRFDMQGDQIIVTNSLRNTGNRTDIRIHLNDRLSKEPIIGGTCYFDELGIYGITDKEGVAEIKNVPYGDFKLEIKYLGYRPLNVSVKIDKTTDFYYKMDETSLSMKEVTVLGTRTENSLTSSITIGEQAIEHIQARNLADLMQLMPGVMPLNATEKGLTGPLRLSFRDLGSDNNNRFGAAVIIDGVQQSTNAMFSSHTSSDMSDEGNGIDLRGFSTSEIESVEIILGVPSVEYGDMSSGAMIVKTKSGETPWRTSVNFDPGSYQGSLSKGWNLTERKSTVNFNFDYMHGASDPRDKAFSLDRINGGINYGKRITDNWRTKTHLKFSSLIDKRTQDPDAVATGIKTKSKKYSYTFAHEGDISLNKLFSRNLNYSLSASYVDLDQWQSKIASMSGTYMPLYDATETGIYEAVILPQSYRTSGGSENKPLSLSGRINNTFYFNSGGVNQRFKIGGSYRFEKNYGKGNYNDNPLLPLNHSAARERRFIDVPATNKIAVWLEDNISFKLANRDFMLTAGLRYEALQPGKEEFVQSLSPRLNLKYQLTKWMSVHGSYGRLAKTPGMNLLYPDKKYYDHTIVKHTPNEESEQIVVYSTHVFSVPYNKGMKNSTTTKWEAGFDIKVKRQMHFTVTAYMDYNPMGFEAQQDYFAFEVTSYSNGKGYTTHDGTGKKPTLDFMQPGYSGPSDTTGVVYANLGLAGNTSKTRNRGIQFNFNFGRIKPLNTTVSLSGALAESRSWSTKTNYSNPTGGPTLFGDSNVTLFKVMANNAAPQIKRNLITTLELVYHIPQVAMVVSGRYYIDWFEYSRTSYHDIIPYAIFELTKQNGEYVKTYTPVSEITDPYYLKLLENSTTIYKDKRSDKLKTRHFFDVRLSKTVADVITFSFYANNATYYNPWKASNKTSTKSRKNQDLMFGGDLTLKF